MTAEIGPVAVLGVGAMSQGMADSLLRAGIRTVSRRSEEEVTVLTTPTQETS